MSGCMRPIPYCTARAPLGRVGAGESRVQQFDNMYDLVTVAPLPCRRPELKNAARVRGYDEIGRGRFEVSRLSLTERCRHFRLHEVEDAGAAAAHLAFGDRDDR